MLVVLAWEQGAGSVLGCSAQPVRELRAGNCSDTKSVTFLLPLHKLGDTMGFSLGLALYPLVTAFPFPNFP